VQKPFEEPVTQFDLGVGDQFSAMYLAKVGQMFIQDGAYGGYRLFSPGFAKRLYPRPIAETAPKLINKEIETGIGLTWMIDPPGDRDQGVLGPNVLGHGSGSGTMWRVALDHELIIVVGRNEFSDPAQNDEWITKFATAVAEQIEGPPEKKPSKQKAKKPRKKVAQKSALPTKGKQ
jgi:CubicO group peptidase (beta-lactamase class C family)